MQHITFLIDQVRRMTVGRDSREPWSYFGSFGDDFLAELEDEAADC